MTSRVGVLFDTGFDAHAHARLEGPALAFDRAGFDLLRFPANLRVLTLDLERMAARLARRARSRGWSAVVSHDETYGALTAALVAEAAGLPGTSPESILACQHKLHARRVLATVCPDANLAFATLGTDEIGMAADELDYPCFVKPVKAAFSILARSLYGPADVQQLLRVDRHERWLMGRLLAPFERVVRSRLPDAGAAQRLLLEERVVAPQYNLDGYMYEGRVHVLGVVDAIMVPGTQAFARWELPSRLPAPVVERARDVAQRFLGAVGFARGFFSLEFFHDPVSDRLSVIEFNPRLSSQFGDLYRQVAGVDPHAMAIALAQGRDPASVERTAPTARIAASLVWRAFALDAVPPQPGVARVAELQRQMPDALLFTFPRSRRALARDLAWLGSHRYGVLQLGAADAGTLQARSARAAALLGWPNAPYATSVVEAPAEARLAPAIRPAT
jgi:biotin carboxylase